MTPLELLYRLGLGAEAAKLIASRIGLGVVFLPPDGPSARTTLAEAIDDKFGAQGTRRLITDGLGPEELLALATRGWMGSEATYVLTSEPRESVSDASFRQLLADLVPSWDSPAAVDGILRLAIGRRWYSSSFSADGHDVPGLPDDASDLEDLDELDEEPLKGSTPEAVGHHTPDWMSEAWFRGGPDETLPAGLHHLSRPLFAHQITSVEKLRIWWKRPHEISGVLCLPTGAGKTRTAVHFLLTHVVPNERVLWLAHRTELVNQAIATLLESSRESKAPFEIGSYGAGRRKIHAPVNIVVGSIPTLSYQRRGELPNLESLLARQERFGLVVVDECHHGVARSWRRLLERLRDANPGMRTLGLSATPTRTSEREQPILWKLFGKILHEVTPLELIRQGILARPQVVTVPTETQFRATPHERQAFEQFGDIPLSLVRRIAENELRNARVIDTYVKRREEWGPTLFFAATIDQGLHITRKLKGHGIRVEDVYGDSKPRERAAVIEAFREGRLEAIVNVGLFTEGTDLPGVESVFLARPTRSRILFQQMVGRGMRGPKLGGSADCNVVAFYDEVLGLMQQKLASTFTSEADAIAAMGLQGMDGPEEAGRDDDGTGSPVGSHADTQLLVERLRELLAAMGTNASNVAGIALEGWWEARRERRRAFLPVFEGAAAAAEGLIRDVLRSRVATDPTTPSGPVEFVPDRVMARFLRVARRPETEITYRSAIDCTMEQGDALLDELERVIDQTAGGDLPDWWTGGDSVEGERVAILVDGLWEPVEQTSYDAVADAWSRFAEALGVDTPAAANNLASLLIQSPQLDEIPKDDRSTLLDAAAEDGVFPAGRKFAVAPPDAGGVLSVLARYPRARWQEILDRAWDRGFSEQFEGRTEAIVAILAQAMA